MYQIGQKDKFKEFFDGLLKNKKPVVISKALTDFFPSRKFRILEKGFKYPGGKRLILYVENGGSNIVLDDYSLWASAGTFKSNAASWSPKERVDVSDGRWWKVNIHRIKNIDMGEQSRWSLEGFLEQ